MIFVTVGTNEARFDRLLTAVAKLELDEELVIQHGHSTPVPMPNSELVDFLAFEDMVETVRRARIVVTHAGVGSIMVCMANAKRPIVIPRRKAFAEAVDDHQHQVGRRFADAGLVTLLEVPDEIGDALRREQRPVVAGVHAGSLAADVGSFLERAIARSSAPTPV